MADVDPRALLEPAATRVRDPVSGRSVWLAGMVREATVDGDTLAFDLVFAEKHAVGDRERIVAALKENLRGLGHAGEVAIRARVEAGGDHAGHAHAPPSAKIHPAVAGRSGLPSPAPASPKGKVPGMDTPGVQPHGGPIQKMPVPGVKHVVAIASGKGGVGKSTVSANLAVALQRRGHAVGLLDADVYGPSVPRMMNISVRPMVDDAQRILPPESYGVKCLSIGMLVAEEEAIIWRGPMVMSLIRQFLQQAHWGELDYLLIDLPPGTGDAQLTLIQATDLAGAVIVTTPQDVALADAIRGIAMFQKLDVPLLGLVENMAYYQLPNGERDYVFGEGGGRRLAEKHGVPVLAEVPLRTALRRSGDQGLPAALGSDATAQVFADLAARFVERLPV